MARQFALLLLRTDEKEEFLSKCARIFTFVGRCLLSRDICMHSLHLGKSNLELDRRVELSVHHPDNQKPHRELCSSVSNGSMYRSNRWGKMRCKKEVPLFVRWNLLEKGGVMWNRLEIHWHIQMTINFILEHPCHLPSSQENIGCNCGVWLLSQEVWLLSSPVPDWC